MEIQQVMSIIAGKKNLTDDVIQLSLSVPENFSFQAGQFVTFFIERSGEIKPRCYSILSPPSLKGKLDFCIKLIPGGFASGFFEKAKKGEKIPLKGPFGSLGFDADSREHVFICASTGIAPLLSIIKEHISQRPLDQFKLILSAKYRKDLLFHAELQKLAQEHPNFEYVPTLTREEWKGRMGRVQNHLEEEVRQQTFYVCGMAEMVKDVKSFLLKKGVSPLKIRS